MKGPLRLSDGKALTRFQAVRHAYAAVKAYCRSDGGTVMINQVPPGSRPSPGCRSGGARLYSTNVSA
jgi:hypothetical protein